MHYITSSVKNRVRHVQEVLREDSDLITLRGLVKYLALGAKKASKMIKHKVHGSIQDSLDEKLQGCSVIFETLENEGYILEVSVHEKYHGVEFIVQGILYSKTNGHFSKDNILEAPRAKFEGKDSMQEACSFAKEFIDRASAQYDLN